VRRPQTDSALTHVGSESAKTSPEASVQPATTVVKAQTAAADAAWPTRAPAVTLMLTCPAACTNPPAGRYFVSCDAYSEPASARRSCRRSNSSVHARPAKTIEASVRMPAITSAGGSGRTSPRDSSTARLNAMISPTSPRTKTASRIWRR
jgi:hypothetical protein